MVRRQAALGTEFRRVYGEGRRLDIITLGTVIQVNYRYNTVDIKLKDNSMIVNSGNQEGRFSAPIPVEFAGTTPEGKPFGQVQPIAVGTTVLVGFEDKHTDRPVVLAVYASADEAHELSRAPFAGASPLSTDLRKHMNQKFTVYPSLTYENIDGVGNRTVSFNGKSFMVFDSDGIAQASGMSDDNEGTQYEDLRTSYYYSGELIEPVNSKAPVILFKHQGDLNTLAGQVPDDHKFMLFLDQDGTYRTSMMKEGQDWRSFFEMSPNGNIIMKHQRDTKSLKESTDFVQFSIGDRGIELRAGDKHVLFNEDGWSGDMPAGAGGGPVEVDLSEIGKEIDGLKEWQTDTGELLISMGTDIEQTAEKIRLSAYQNTVLEEAIKSYQAEFVVMARQIYSAVQSTEISGRVSESLQSLAHLIITIANRAEKDLAKLTALASDNKLTREEKMELNPIWLSIKDEYPGYVAQAEDAEVDIGEFTSAYSFLANYLPPLFVNETEESLIDSVVFMNAFRDYYTERTGSLQAIYEKLQADVQEVAMESVGAAQVAGLALAKAATISLKTQGLYDNLRVLASDESLNEDEKAIVRRYLRDTRAEYEEAMDPATEYEIPTGTLTAAKANLDFLDEALDPTDLDPLEITPEALVNSFMPFYTELMNIYRSLITKTQAVLDSYAGDVTHHASKVIQTDREITQIVSSTELQGALVAVSQARFSIESDGISFNVRRVTLQRDINELINLLNSGGRNLYIQSRATSGTLNTQGELVPATEGDKVSHYIAVIENEKFTTSLHDNVGSNTIRVFWYDIYGKPISTDSVTDTGKTFSLTAEAPKGAQNARVTAKRLPESKLQFEIGSRVTGYKLSSSDTIDNVVLAKEQYENYVALYEKYQAMTQQSDADGVEDRAIIDGASSDNIIDVSEKPQLKVIWDKIESEYPELREIADTYFLEDNVLIGHYTTLEGIMTTVLENMTTASNISGTALRNAMKGYTDERSLLLRRATSYVKNARDTAYKSVMEATASAAEAERIREDLIRAAENASRNIALMKSYRDEKLDEKASTLSVLDGFLMDDAISPVEKHSLRRILDQFEEEQDWMTIQANVYGLSTNNLDSTYNQLRDYIEPMLTMDKVVETTAVIKQTFLSHFGSYYSAREHIINNVIAGAEGAYSHLELRAREAMEQSLRKDEEYIQYVNALNDAQLELLDINATIEDLQNAVPYYVELTSSRGSLFTNNNVETVLTARLLRGNMDITHTIPDTGFVWTKQDKDGKPDTAWDNLHKDVGNEITITHEDIDEKGIITIEIFEEVG